MWSVFSEGLETTIITLNMFNINTSDLQKCYYGILPTGFHLTWYNRQARSLTYILTSKQFLQESDLVGKDWGFQGIFFQAEA